MADVLLSELKDRVLLLTINRPEAMNCSHFGGGLELQRPAT